MAEDAIELVEVALVFHQRRAREIVEVLDPPPREVLSIASISVRYSRNVTGTPAALTAHGRSDEHWRKLARHCAGVSRPHPPHSRPTNTRRRHAQ